MDKVILQYNEIGYKEAGQVGGKNASIGELHNHISQKGIKVPKGFAIAISAYKYFIKHNNLEPKLQKVLEKIDNDGYSNLAEISLQARKLIINASIPKDLEDTITAAYETTFARRDQDVAVRSSVVAQGVYGGSSGYYESFLNIRGSIALIYAIKCCYASLYNENALRYRASLGFNHNEGAVSIGIQQMIRADLACSGIAYTGDNNMTCITGNWGLGQNLKANLITPDEYYISRTVQPGIIKYLGTKSKMLVYNEVAAGTNSTFNTITPGELREQFVLNDTEAQTLNNYVISIEEYLNTGICIEWAKDGIDNQIYIVQAQPKE